MLRETVIKPLLKTTNCMFACIFTIILFLISHLYQSSSYRNSFRNLTKDLLIVSEKGLMSVLILLNQMYLSTILNKKCSAHSKLQNIFEMGIKLYKFCLIG